MAKKKGSVIPIDRIIENEYNAYELTTSTIKRAEQLSITRGEEFNRDKRKVVSEAIKEVVSGEVRFEFKE